jgi:hypothetical protein
MGKVGKTFTLDLQVLMWLADYAKNQGKKESAIVNALLNSAKRQDESWVCPDCKAPNDNSYSNCFRCDYVVSVKA